MAKLTNERKSQLRKTIAELEGLSVEDKSALIELLNTHKKYGLVWEDKLEDVEEAMRDHLPLFTEVKERAILSDSPEAPNHILIEGDNLEALTALSYTHEGKIDVIYIDPPYNTGNKDFIYNDSFVDSEDAYRHSKWLSFMSRRLKLAKRLLSDKGVIFISIDDNEQANLKLLCDEILSGGYVETFIWNKTSTPPALSYKSRKTHEFVLCYQKRYNSEKFVGLVNEGGDAPLLNESNKQCTLSFPANLVHTNLVNGIYLKGERERVTLLDDVEVLNGIIITPFRLVGNFRWSQSTLDFEISNNCMFIVKSNKFAIRYCREGERTVAPQNFLIEKHYDTTINKEDQGVDTNEKAGKELIAVLGVKKFDFPKPVSLISYLLSFNNNKNSIILDFFAGSGTTLHATMQLNAEDGGRRKCILVTNNENNICEEVTYERNKRVINGYTTPKGEKVEGLKNNSLRYYKTKLMSRERTIKNMRALMAVSTELVCIKNDLYAEQEEFFGRKLNKDVARYFDDRRQQMLIVYNEQAVESIIEVLREVDVEQRIKIYLFSNNGYAYNDNFEEVLDKVELCALPAAIYNAYEHVLPKNKEEEND